MTNKVISFHSDPYGEHKLGFCKVDAGGKCILTLSVFKSKAGNICCGFSNLNIEGNWVPSFEFTDKDYERKFLGECRDQVVKLMDPIEEKQEYNEIQTGRLPF